MRAESGLAQTTERRIHAEARDSSVDAVVDVRVPTAPDLVSAVVDVAQGNVAFSVRLRPGSFDAVTEAFVIDLDTDQNSSTGTEGVEYYVRVFPANGRGADVVRTMGTATSVVGTIPVSFVADGFDLSIPSSLLGDDDGRFDFRVRVLSERALPIVFDSIPDTGFVRVQ